MSNDPSSDLHHAQDLRVGTRYELGEYHVSTDEIVEFARRWDPQYFHVDPVAAEQSIFGGLIASGLHTMAIFQRLSVERVYQHWAVIAGRRLRDIELVSPVRGGMTLSGVVEIEAIRLEPKRALVTTRGQLSADGRKVMESVFETYVHSRPTD